MATTTPDLVTLRIFLAAVRLGTLTRAAEQCGIALSAAAKRIHTLEEDCGIALLLREARGVRPTLAGESMARHAEMLLNLSGRIMNDMHGFAAGGRGSVRLQATLSAIAGHPLPGMLAGFATRNPGLRTELKERTSLAILRDLAEGRADLGIVTSGSLIPPDLEASPWRNDSLLAVMRQDHPLAAQANLPFAAMLDQPLIGASETGALAFLLEEQAQRLGRPLEYRFQVASTDVSRCLVAAGHGVAVMPEGVVRPYEALLGIRGVPLREGWARRSLHLVSTPPDTLQAPARLLREYLLNGDGNGP